MKKNKGVKPHTVLLILLYIVCFVILIFNYKHLIHFDNTDKIVTTLSLIALSILSISYNRNYIENFEEDVQTEINTESTEDNTSNDDNISNEELKPIVKTNNTDNLPTKHFIRNYPLICYFSTYTDSSFDLITNTWKDQASPINSHKIKLKNVEDVSSIYHQQKGINLGVNHGDHVELEGYPSNELAFINQLKDFTIFWYARMDFSVFDYLEFIPQWEIDSIEVIENKFNNFKGNQFVFCELYSSNVTGNIAIGCKLFLKKRLLARSSTEYVYVETFEINYGGLKFTYEINPTIKHSTKIYFNDDKKHLFTLVKYVENGKHLIKMVLDDEKSFLIESNIDPQSISYSTNSRKGIKLSKENFVLNKQFDGNSQNIISYQSLRMYLSAFGIFNRSIHQSTVNNNVNIIKQLYEHLNNEEIKLSNIYITTTSELETQKAEQIESGKCKMSTSVCNACSNVNWSSISDVMASSTCSEAIIKHCNDIDDNKVNPTNDDLGICYAVRQWEKRVREKVETELGVTNSSNVKLGKGYNQNCNGNNDSPHYQINKRTSYEGLKSIGVDTVKRNNYNTSPSIGKLADGDLHHIDYTKLDNDDYVKKHIIDDMKKHTNTDEKQRMDVYYNGTSDSGASRNEPPLLDTYNMDNQYINPNNLSNYDTVSKHILDKPVHNLKYNELLELVKAKKNEIRDVNTMHNESVSQLKTSDKNDIIPIDPSLNEKELYDSIMAKYKKELKESELDDEDTEDIKKQNNDDDNLKSESVISTGRVSTFFKSMFGL